MIQNSYSTLYLNIKTDNTFNNFRQSTQENKKKYKWLVCERYGLIALKHQSCYIKHVRRLMLKKK